MSALNGRMEKLTHGEQDWMVQEPDGSIFGVHRLSIPEEPRKIPWAGVELAADAFNGIKYDLYVPAKVVRWEGG